MLDIGMALNFKKKIVLTEHLAILQGYLFGLVIFFSQQGLRNLPAQTSRKRDQPLGVLTKQFLINARLIVKTLEVAGSGQLNKIAISMLIAGKQHKVVVDFTPGLIGRTLIKHILGNVRLHANNR